MGLENVYSFASYGAMDRNFTCREWRGECTEVAYFQKHENVAILHGDVVVWNRAKKSRTGLYKKAPLCVINVNFIPSRDEESINVLFCFNSSISIFFYFKIFMKNNTGYEELMQGGNVIVMWAASLRKITEKCIFKKHSWCHWFDYWGRRR